MSDLVKRLRGIYSVAEGTDLNIPDRDFSSFIPPISLEAADFIELIEQKNKELKAHNKSLMESMQDWTEIKDGLPPADGLYLVYQGDNRFSREFKDGAWVNAKIEKYGEITHWAYLPHKPKRQDEHE